MIEGHLDQERSHPRDPARALLRSPTEVWKPQAPPSEKPGSHACQREGDVNPPAHPKQHRNDEGQNTANHPAGFRKRGGVGIRKRVHEPPNEGNSHKTV
jgi:hypothetical protein